MSYEGIFERPSRKFLCGAPLQRGAHRAVRDGDRSTHHCLAGATRPSTYRHGIKADQVGITHIGLWVCGLDTVYEDLKSKGVKFVVTAHATKTPTGEIRSAFSLDPDGMLIQLG